MTANVNSATGISYGVVSMNSLADWVFDEFFYNGTNVSYEGALADFRAEHDITEDNEDEEENSELLEQFNNSYMGEEECYTLETDGMKLEINYLGGAALVWVIESPITAQCAQCSPCCPNAGDLDNRETEDRAGNTTAYTLPDNWFRSEDE